MSVEVFQMNKITKLIVIVGAIIALAGIVVATIAITGTVTATTWDIFQGFVVVMGIIFVIGAALIADETRKEKLIDYTIKKASTT